MGIVYLWPLTRTTGIPPAAETLKQSCCPLAMLPTVTVGWCALLALLAPCTHRLSWWDPSLCEVHWLADLPVRHLQGASTIEPL